MAVRSRTEVGSETKVRFDIDVVDCVVVKVVLDLLWVVDVEVEVVVRLAPEVLLSLTLTTVTVVVCVVTVDTVSWMDLGRTHEMTEEDNLSAGWDKTTSVTERALIGWTVPVRSLAAGVASCARTPQEPATLTSKT